MSLAACPLTGGVRKADMVRTASLFIGTLLLGARVAAAEPPALDLIAVPGGEFVMGDVEGEPDEAPKRTRVAAFRIMRHEVTNRQFAAFVAAGGYRSAGVAAGAGVRSEERRVGKEGRTRGSPDH